MHDCYDEQMKKKSPFTHTSVSGRTLDQIETSIRKKAFSDAGITEEQKQKSLLKSAANPGSSSISNAAAASTSESADVDVEGLAESKIEEKV